MQMDAMVTMETGLVARRDRDSERNRLGHIGERNVRRNLERNFKQDEKQ